MTRKNLTKHVFGSHGESLPIVFSQPHVLECQLEDFPQKEINNKMGDLTKFFEQTNDILEEFKQSLFSTITTARVLRQKLSDGELNTEDGISLFDVKNKMFVGYLIDLTDICRMRVQIRSLVRNDALNRILEERTVLERIRPIEHKLKYQVDKLMKVLNDDNVDKNDPLNCKPNFSNISLDNLNEDVEHDADNVEGADEEIKKTKSGVYVPPRVAQMKFEDEEERMNKALERAKKRAVSSSIIKELRKEYDDAPEEEHDSLLHQKSKIGKYLKERKRFEEDNFVRINLTKKQKTEARKLTTVTSLADDITRFEDISVLDLKNAKDFHTQKRKKNKNKSSKRHKK